MFSFAQYIDLPLVWGGLIATAVFVYVILDGFDLGMGILFPFAPTDNCRNKMMNSIAPFWDGNETWLILGGGGIFAAFPYAYSILMPAFYIPVIIMLIALIFRGVAFEFRFKSGDRSRKIWDYSFHFGSVVAAFAQGVMLGTYLQGIKVVDRAFAGGAFDWLNAFSIITGLAVIFAYALIGATWMIMKTDGETANWSKKVVRYVLFYIIIFMFLAVIWLPLLEIENNKWLKKPFSDYVMIIPFAIVFISFMIIRLVNKGREYSPFLLTTLLFLIGYIGILFSIWPWIVPFNVSLWDAAAIPESQSLMLVGVVPILPIILFYTGYCYYIFRGKVGEKNMY